METRNQSAMHDGAALVSFRGRTTGSFVGFWGQHLIFKHVDVEILIEDFSAVEGKSAECLISCGGGKLAPDGKVAQDCGCFFLLHFPGMSFSVKEYESSDPARPGIFGVDAGMFGPEPVKSLVEKLRRLRGGHLIFLYGRSSACRAWLIVDLRSLSDFPGPYRRHRRNGSDVPRDRKDTASLAQ